MTNILSIFRFTTGIFLNYIDGVLSFEKFVYDKSSFDLIVKFFIVFKKFELKSQKRHTNLMKYHEIH